VDQEIGATGGRAHARPPLSRRHDRLRPWLFIAPALAVIAAVFLFPVIEVARISLFRVAGSQETFLGMGNYLSLFRDDAFLRSLQHNLELLVSVPLMLFMSLVLAVILFEGVAGWRIYRSVLFMPYILSIPVVGIVFGYIFQLNGILNTFLRAAGLDLLAADWLGSSRFALWTVMGVIVWKELGFGVVLFLARLMSVDEELYEAAALEGAGWLQVLFRITIPQLATVIEFYVVIMVITMLSWVFNYVYVMTSGGPGSSTMVAEYYIYLEGFRYNLQGVAAAASMVLLAVTALLIIIRANITRRIELE
jgi:putative chitobiose transport system permease protein